METIAARKYAIIEKVMNFNEEELIEFETSLVEFQEEPISIEQYNSEINEPENEIANGEFYTQDEVEKMSKKW